ncbi:hypothetical protein D7D25_09995 [Proteiniphilum sp. X52]|nr:hypothetical protein D7D25_09995 [Proteiniphilum sp. X52]
MKIQSQTLIFYYIGLFQTGKNPTVRIQGLKYMITFVGLILLHNPEKLCIKRLNVIELNDIQDFSGQL